MRKKGQVANPLFDALVLAVVMGVMLWLAYIIAGGIFQYTSGGMCSLTAFAMSKTKPLGQESPLIAKLDCKTRHISIREDGVYSYYNRKYVKDPVYRDFKKDSEYYIQKAVAEEMRQCWRYLGEGELDPFGNFDGAKKCVICSQIYFDEKVSAKYPNFPDFREFLQDNYMKSEAGEQMSYWEYITDNAQGELRAELQTETMAVMFTEVKPDSSWNVAGDLIGTGYAATGCTSFPATLQAVSAVLRKVPGPGKLAGVAIGASKAASKGRAGFAWACKKTPDAAKKNAGRAIFYGGVAKTVYDAQSGHKPAVIGIQVVPIEDVSKECDKLY